MDAGQTMYRPWCGSQFSYDKKSELSTFIRQGVCTGIEHDGRTVLSEGQGLVVDDGEWYATEAEARRRLVVMLIEKWEALRVQIDAATAELTAVKV